MPIAQRVLYLLEFVDELHRFRGWVGKLRRVAGFLTQDAVLVQYSFGERRTRAVKPLQHGPGDCQRIPAGPRIDALGGAFQPLPNLANGGSIRRLAQLFFLLSAQLDQVVHQLRLAPRFPRNFQTAQRRQLHVQIAHLTGALTDSAQQLQKFFLAAVELWRKLAQQNLQAACARTEAMHTLRPRFRGKLDQVPFKLLKNLTAALGSDRHMQSELEQKNTGLSAKRQPRKAAPF